MSWQPDNDPVPGNPRSCDAIEQVIVPRARDLGGFSVRRALPAAGKQMVGPFIFFDQMGPAEFLIGSGIDVRPHPHIGLATVTYLFDGEIVHRDSLGTALAIRPGELNLMSAGSGIVHSERTGAEERAKGPRLFGIQAWAALPKAHEEGAPAFAHHDAGELPRIAGDGKTVRVIMGSLYGQTSPAAFPHPAFYAEAVLAPGAVLPLDPDYDERAVYIASGEIDIAGETFDAGRLLVFRPGRPHLDPRDLAGAADAARRRADGRAAPHLVEFRVLVEGPHRRRQGRLEGQAFRHRTGRRGRVHPAAGVRPRAVRASGRGRHGWRQPLPPAAPPSANARSLRSPRR